VRAQGREGIDHKDSPMDVETRQVWGQPTYDSPESHTIALRGHSYQYSVTVATNSNFPATFYLFLYLLRNHSWFHDKWKYANKNELLVYTNYMANESVSSTEYSSASSNNPSTHPRPRQSHQMQSWSAVTMKVTKGGVPKIAESRSYQTCSDV